MAGKCLFCGSVNLNTTLTVKVDGQPHTVALCENCEDQTPKSIRQQLERDSKNRLEEQKRQQKMKQLQELAAELGVDINNIPVISKQPPVHKPAPISTKPHKLVPQKNRQTKQPIAEPIAESPTPVEPTTQPPSGVESHSGYSQKDLAYCKIQTTAKENQVVETSTRGPIPLPKRIFDNEGGNTDIRIVKTGNRELQRRFESMAAASKANDNSHHFGKSGYNINDCPACGGSGKARTDPKQTCPKCNGGGIFERQ